MQVTVNNNATIYGDNTSAYRLRPLQSISSRRSTKYIYSWTHSEVASLLILDSKLYEVNNPSYEAFTGHTSESHPLDN